MTKKPILTICASIHFYEEVAKIQKTLGEQGIKVVIPYTAERMKAAQNFDVATFKPTPEEFKRKAELMRGHFDAVEAGDAILVVNNEKHGQPNYIGGNVLMEMALAFHLKQPIFLLNDVPEQSPYLDEIAGMEPVALHGSLDTIVKTLIK